MEGDGAPKRRWLWGLGAGLLAAMVFQFVAASLPVGPPDLPTRFAGSQREAFENAWDHLMPLLNARCFGRCVSVLALLLVLVSGIPSRIEQRFGRTPYRWAMRLLFFAGLYVWLRAVKLPFAYWTYLHDYSFGLTPMTGAEWWLLLGQGAPITFLLFLLKCVLLFCLIAVLRRHWWIGAALTMFLLFSVIPEWISLRQPISPVEERQPLPESEIRDQFEALAEQTGRQLELVMVDQSKRSTRVNMALTGRMGREYVLVTDTLLNALTPAEARAMLAHELGHDVTRHITLPLRKVLGLGSMLLTYYLVFVWFGRVGLPELQIPRCIVRILLVGKLVGYLITPVTAAVNRYQEWEADDYAIELTQDPAALESLLLTAAELNLEPYDVPRWAYAVYGSSHPTIRQRVENARKAMDAQSEKTNADR